MNNSDKMVPLVVPDFDTYPVTHQLQRATPIAQGIELLWNDGLTNQVPVIWLREFSPDPGTFHSVTREQRIALTDIPQDLSIAQMLIAEDGFLEVDWMPEDLHSRYHPGWLRCAVADPNDPMDSLPDRKLWPLPVTVKPNWLNGAAVYRGDTDALRIWLETLLRDGIGLLDGLPAIREVIPAVVELIGPIRASNFGDVFEVESLPSANSNAYTALPLKVHSDLATREYIPGMQFLFCLENEATGGESLLVDGFAAAQQLNSESTEFFEVLATLPVPFGTKDREFDHRYCAPVLEHNAVGELSSVRHTYWLRSPMSGDFSTLNTFYAAYRRFQEICDDPDNQLRFRLQPGQLMAFDNRRVLHGRDAFDPESGRRLLRGCYGEREEVESRLRILYRALRAQEQTQQTGVRA